MKKQIKVSVIIPFYKKTLGQLKQAIKSVRKQADEIIVVNDGDKKINKKFFKNVKLLQYKKNQGANHARNFGFANSDGDYVMFLDPDDWLEPNVIPNMVKILEKDKKVSYVYGNYILGNKLFKPGKFDIKRLKIFNYIDICVLVREKDMIFFDETIKRFQDWDLWLTMAEQGKYGKYIDKVIVNIERDSTSKSMQDNFEEATNIVKIKHGLTTIRRIWRGHGYVIEKLIASPIFSVSIKKGEKKKSVFDKKVVIIFVTKDLEKITKKFLKSLVKNTKQKYELIWVDNGSTPLCRNAILTFLIKNIKKYRYIWNSNNEGWLYGVNEALQIIENYDYVVLANNDIEVPKNWLVNMISVAEHHKKFGLVGPIVDEGIIGWQRVNYLPEFLKKERFSIIENLPLAFFCVLIRKEVMDKLGGLDRKFGKYGLGEDDDFCKRARELGYSILITTEVMVKHKHRTTFKAEHIDYLQLQKEHKEL